MLKPSDFNASCISDIGHDEYHADPCPIPSLNHTVAKILIERSPMHAYRAHPRLGGEKNKSNRVMDIGSAAHAMALGVGNPVRSLKFKDFRTKAAQETRDAMLQNGITPLLEDDYNMVLAMAPLLRAGIEDVAGKSIDNLLREISVFGLEDGMWSRCKPDAMTADFRLIIDAKTTLTAHPEDYSKKVLHDYATAVAFTFQTLDLLDPEGVGKRRYVFVVQERDCPEAITYHELDPTMLEIAQSQMQRARRRWAHCVRTNEWPAYDRGPHMAVPPQYIVDEEMGLAHDEAMAAHVEAMKKGAVL